MRKIFKYKLSAPKRPLDILTTTVEMPRGARILDVQVQNQDGVDEGPQIWALVDPEAEMEERHFHVFPTGIEIPDFITESMFIKTFQLYRGRLVFHVFEKPVESKA